MTNRKAFNGKRPEVYHKAMDFFGNDNLSVVDFLMRSDGSFARIVFTPRKKKGNLPKKKKKLRKTFRNTTIPTDGRMRKLGARLSPGEFVVLGYSGEFNQGEEQGWAGHGRYFAGWYDFTLRRLDTGVLTVCLDIRFHGSYNGEITDTWKVLRKIKEPNKSYALWKWIDKWEFIGFFDKDPGSGPEIPEARYGDFLVAMYEGKPSHKSFNEADRSKMITRYFRE